MIDTRRVPELPLPVYPPDLEGRWLPDIFTDLVPDKYPEVLLSTWETIEVYSSHSVFE